MERDASRADVSEQQEPADDTDEEITEIARDAGEADVLDQHRAARPGEPHDEPPSIAPDVPEADALEQARVVPEDEESGES